jgi:hypothetical protein
VPGFNFEDVRIEGAGTRSKAAEGDCRQLGCVARMLQFLRVTSEQEEVLLRSPEWLSDQTRLEVQLRSSKLSNAVYARIPVADCSVHALHHIGRCRGFEVLFAVAGMDFEIPSCFTTARQAFLAYNRCRGRLVRNVCRRRFGCYGVRIDVDCDPYPIDRVESITAIRLCNTTNIEFEHRSFVPIVGLIPIS